jgi:signal transduction histidine kinase
MSTAVSNPAGEVASLRSLRWLSKALGSAKDVAAAGSAAEACLSEALGSAARVVLSEPNRSGGAEIVWCNANGEQVDRKDHSAERRAVLETERPVRVREHDRSALLVAMLPLSCHGETVGVLEVHGEALAIEGAWDVLESVADLLGPALHGISQRRDRQGRDLRLATIPGAVSTTDAEVDGADDGTDLRLAWTAHELRGPISALKAALGFLGEEELTARHKALIAQCLAELDHMSTLVSETQRWGDSIEPREPLSRSECEVVGVVRSSIEQIKLASGVDRVVLHAIHPVLADVDPVQLRSAIGNLIRNAIMYSPAQTPVDVAVAVETDMVVITVGNVGRAISEGELKGIFLPFVRGANVDGRDGMGLGLFIARHVAEANGGRLTLHLHEETTEFQLHIPRRSR